PREVWLLDFFFLDCVRRDAKRAQEALVVGADLELPFLRRQRGQRFLRRRSGTGQRTRLGAIDETNHGLERDFHLEARGARALTDGLHTSILGNRGSNGVG